MSRTGSQDKLNEITNGNVVVPTLKVIPENNNKQTKDGLPLLDNEELYLDLFELSNDAIFIHKDGKILNVNQRASDLTGYTRDELLKMTLMNLYHKGIVEDFKKTIKKSKNQKGFRYETKFKRSDGGVIDVEFSGKLIDENRFVFQEIARDITERKEAEVKKTALLNELAEKNQELDDYTYIVSHDLKAPLVTIQGFADLIKRKYGEMMDEKCAHYFDNIINGAQEMNKLIQDLLELSRAGRREGKLQKLNFKKSVESSLNSIIVMVGDSRADVRIHDDLSKIDFDPTQLRQVITNLVSNAIKYSKPERRPEIEIGGRWDDTNALIWVQDNGMGITEENQKKIFQPFFRVKKEKDGTGIGLSIVKKIVEKHGGNLWVESNPGIGSTFFFTVPKEVKTCMK